ncbi:F-box/FBD/LRR-repeat protein At1g13570-like [Rutidosis leptorrhynchoides]|uniref:F-box/FBD/LRR-repeat protein At1g13570-like n=1 Tax=Rutidosis leptorrhynchoides TaxID=125765 RepID=UPI003A995746
MKPECSSSDIISGVPQYIIEAILCMVPIRDAVRTSILSKRWRYSWNRIPKLVVNEEDMFDEMKELTGRCKLFYAIHQVLLMHQGSILELSLSIDADNKCVEIDQIITYLSRKNTVKKLTLELNGYKLPLSFFSLHQLTSLYLQHCNLDHQPTTINGFGCLESINLINLVISKELIIHLVSKSPLLKSFAMVNISDDNNNLSPIFSRAFICELLGYMPAIQQLYLDSDYEYVHQSDSSLPKIPTQLVHLKYAVLHEPFFMGDGLHFAVSLIRSSPNLEKIKLQSIEDPEETLGIDSLTATEYSDIWLEHLKELELKFNHEIQGMEFLKLIMARSPMLKVVIIHIRSTIDKDLMLRVISNIPRASDMVKIIVKHLVVPESPTDDEG